MTELFSLETLAVIFLLTITAFGLQSSSTSETYNATLTSVTDGDTIDIVINGRNDTVRFLGVDTPETKSGNNPEEFGMENTASKRACLERYGEEAANFVERELSGDIRVETDPSAHRRGGYGRLLAYVYDSNTSVNRKLLEKGLARVYTGTFSKEKEYLKIEENAREEGRGLWSCTNNTIGIP